MLKLILSSFIIHVTFYPVFCAKLFNVLNKNFRVHYKNTNEMLKQFLYQCKNLRCHGHRKVFLFFEMKKRTKNQQQKRMDEKISKASKRVP
jgi:hypothetical protein